MSIDLSSTFNGKCHTLYIGDLTLLFSYETLVGFAVPNVGSVTIQNIWSTNTGKHINSFPAKYEGVEPGIFDAATDLLDLHLEGKISRTDLCTRLKEILS